MEDVCLPHRHIVDAGRVDSPSGFGDRCFRHIDGSNQRLWTIGWAYTHDACSRGPVQFLTQLKADAIPLFHWPRQRAQHKLLGTPIVRSCPRPSISGSFETVSEACCICSLFFWSRLWLI